MRALVGRIALFAITFSVASANPGARVVGASSDDQRIESEIRRLNDEEVQAFVHNDSRAMAQLWSDDFVVTNPLNRFVTKKDVLGMVDSGFLAIPSYERQIEYVHVYGQVVIVAGSETVLWGGKMPNAGKTEHLRFTAVWMRRAGLWQEVARHANIVPASAGKTQGQ
jgi:ketosteroid isomerase-like protein